MLSAATPHDLYTALALAIRDRMLKQGVKTLENYHERDARVVAERLPVAGDPTHPPSGTIKLTVAHHKNRYEPVFIPDI